MIDCQLKYGLGIADSGEIIYFGTNAEGRQVGMLFHFLPKQFLRFPSLAKEVLGGIMPRVEMRRCYHMAHALLRFHTQHGDGFFQRAAAIIDSGKHMAVKVDDPGHHFALPARAATERSLFS